MKTSELRRVLEQIELGKVSREDAATKLDVSERTVNRLMLKHGVERPTKVSPAHAAREAAAKRRAAKLVVMERAAAGGISVAEAVKLAKVHERTVFRWLARLKNSAKTTKKRRK